MIAATRMFTRRKIKYANLRASPILLTNISNFSNTTNTPLKTVSSVGSVQEYICGSVNYIVE